MKKLALLLLFSPLLILAQVKDYTFDKMLQYESAFSGSNGTITILLNSKDASYALTEVTDDTGTFSKFLTETESIQGKVGLDNSFVMTKIDRLEGDVPNLSSISEKKSTVSKFGTDLNLYTAIVSDTEVSLYINPSESLNLATHLEKVPDLFIYFSFVQTPPSGMLYEIGSNSYKVLTFNSIKTINKTISLDLEALKKEHADYTKDLAARMQPSDTYYTDDSYKIDTADDVAYDYTVSSNSDYNKSVIENFLKAEDNRKIDNISTFYANTVARYWDVYNPTHKQITDSYEKVWKSITYSKNEVLEMNNIDDAGKIWDVSINFKFKTAKKPDVQSKKTKVRIELNDDSEIVKIFGINADE